MTEHRSSKGSDVSTDTGNPNTGNTDTGGAEPKSAANRLFDLRWLIAAMFVVYGLVLTVTGILDDAAEIKKAAGVRINLWTGIGMLVIGLFFAVWARWKPLKHEL